jgi:hypothetical protein
MLHSPLDDENVVVMDSDRDALERALVLALRTRRADLAALFAKHSDHWRFEDPVYRFYHQSLKVFGLQSQTTEIVGMLAQLVPGRPMNSWFTTIVANGTGRTFEMRDNANWTEVTRPILEAFFHARYFLEMAVRYSELESPPSPLPSGYAALLYLFDLR